MKTVAEVLRAVKDGKVSLKQAEKQLKFDAIAAVGDLARLDRNRFLRRGVPEIIYAQNKSNEQLSLIVKRLLSVRKEKADSLPVIMSKVREDQVLSVRRAASSAEKKALVKYYPDANIVAIFGAKAPKIENVDGGRVALLAAGTSDVAALNEAEVILNLFGCRTIRFNDAGVAGLHRLVEPLRKISKFDPDAIIVAAGMEGALPSVVAGLSSVPVIGLPTSVGYGFGGNGESALMSMLQACSLGICVVNIDGGVAAGVVAWLISKRKGQMLTDFHRKIDKRN